MGKFLNTTPLSKKHTPFELPPLPPEFQILQPLRFCWFWKDIWHSTYSRIPNFQKSNELSTTYYVMEFEYLSGMKMEEFQKPEASSYVVKLHY